MKAPQIPSLFKNNKPKKFNFTPRYYIFRNKKSKRLINKYRNLSSKKEQKGRIYKITFLIIILSLFAYKLLIN